MAPEPVNATEMILRQIQEVLSHHTRLFNEMSGRFDRLDRRLDEHRELTTRKLLDKIEMLSPDEPRRQIAKAEEFLRAGINQTVPSRFNGGN